MSELTVEEAAGATRVITRLAAKAGATEADVHRAFASLGLEPYGEEFIPMVQACGHPSTSRVRRAAGAKGYRCIDCDREKRAARR